MSTLPDVLTNEEKKPAIVDDCLALIDAEVADKGGISGLAIKAGYAAVKGVKPGFIKQAVSERVADALLAITDAKAKKSKSGVVKGTYDKLRGSAKKNVEAAVPRLGKMIEKYSG
jgi:hypothetical protein